MQPKVSIVIVNYNGKKFLDECLESLLSLAYPAKRVELIIVDNGSKDGSVAYVKKQYPKVLVLENEENNYCSANNLGIQKAKGEYICFLNNDTRVTEDWLRELISFIQGDDRIGAVGSKILFMDGKIQSAGQQQYPHYYYGDEGFREEDRGQYETPREVSSLSGCSILYRRACLEDIGLFDEDFRFFLEDVDMGIRAHEKDWKFFYVPKSVLHHHYHGTFTDSKALISSQEEWLIERNRLLLIAKHWPNELSRALSGIRKYVEKKGPEAEKYISSIISDMFRKLITAHNPQLISVILPELIEELERYYNYEHGLMIQKLAEQQEVITSLKKEFNETLKAKDKELRAVVKAKDAVLNTKLKEKHVELTALMEAKDAELTEKLKEKNAELKEMMASKQQELTEVRAAKDAEVVKTIELKDKELAEKLNGQILLLNEKTVELDALRTAKDAKLKEMRVAKDAELAKQLKLKDEELAEKLNEKDLALEAKEAELNEVVAAKDARLEKELRRKNEQLAELKEAKLVELAELKEAKLVELAELMSGKDAELGKALKLKDTELTEKLKEINLTLKEKEVELNRMMAAKDIELQKRDSTITRLSSEIDEVRLHEKALEETIQSKDEVLKIMEARNATTTIQKETELHIIEAKLEEQYKRLFHIESTVRDRDEAFANHKIILEEKERLITEAGGLVKEKEKELREVIHSMKEYEESLAACRNLLKDMENRGNALEAKLREKDEEKQSLQEKLERSEEIISENAAWIKEKDEIIQGLYHRREDSASGATEEAPVHQDEPLKQPSKKSADDKSAPVKLPAPLPGAERVSSEWLKTYFSHLRKNTLPPTPERLTLMLTSENNLECSLADMSERQYDKKELTRDESFKIIHEAVRIGVKRLDITGGEPLLHGNIFEILEKARSLGLLVTLHTNGILLKRHMDRLLKAKLHCIVVSVHGFKETHMKVCNITAHYDDIIWSLEYLHKHGQAVAAHCIVAKENIHELEDLYDYLHQKGVPLRFSPVLGKPRSYIMQEEERKGFKDLIRRLRREGAITEGQFRYQSKIFDYFDAGKTRTRCLGLCRSFGVDVYGDLVTCNLWNNPERPVPYLGNLFENDLEELWYSEKARGARVSVYQSGCGGCFHPDLSTFLQTGKPFLIKAERRPVQPAKKREQWGKQRQPQIIKGERPVIVHMRLTSRCNMSCKHCDIWREKRTEKELSSEDWGLIIDKMHGWLGSFWLELAGGEMFLRKDLPDIIRHAKKKGIDANITTNAMLIDHEVADQIVEAGLQSLSVSLDGVKPETHNFLRNNDKAFDILMQNVLYVDEQRKKKGKRMNINIATVINDTNLDELEDIVMLTEKDLFSSVTFQALDNNFHAQYDPQWYEASEFWPKEPRRLKRALDKLIEMKREGFRINNDIDQLAKLKQYFSDPGNIVSTHICDTGDMNFIINEYGKVLLCWNMEPVGDILEEDPQAIWKNGLAEKRRGQIRQCDWTCRILNCNFDVYTTNS